MKNLETEYKKSQQEETPDLWNRIETSLTSKAPLTDRQEISFVEKKESKAAKKIYFARFLKVAAAVLVLAVLLPGAAIFLRQGVGRSDNAAMDTTNQEIADMQYDGVAAEAGEAEDFSAECDSGEDNFTSGTTTNREDGIMTADMTVEQVITEGAQTIYYLRTESGELYSAVLKIASKNEALQESNETEELSSDMSSAPVLGETYRVSLYPVNGQEWQYEICDIH